MARITDENKHLDGASLARVQAKIQTPDGSMPPLLLTPYVCAPLGGSRAAPSPRLPPIQNNQAASAILRLPTLKLPPPPSPSPDPRAPPAFLGPNDWPIPSSETRMFEDMLRGGGWRRGEGRGPGR
jgi:hypothetical protein